MMQLGPPVAGTSRNPLKGASARDLQVYEAGKSLREIAPENTGTLICHLTSKGSQFEGYVSRESWDYPLQHGDIVLWEDHGGNRGTLRIVLGLAIAVASAWIGNAYGAGWGIAFAFGGQLLLNAVLPLTGPNAPTGPTGSQVYSASLAGNEARLDQPVWKIVGRRRVTPPFAAPPYFYFDADGDQFYSALLAVGIGNHTLVAERIGQTPIGHFQDVIVHQYLPPGTTPSRVLANVQTNAEVQGLPMDTGAYVGGYPGCKPRRKCTKVGIDFMAPNGMTKAMQWRVEYREINDFDQPLTAWAQLGSLEDRANANTTTPQRWSIERTFASAIRPEIRVVRTDTENTAPGQLDKLEWVGLRGILSDPAPLNPNVAHYEVVLRASKQLAGQSLRDVNLTLIGHARTWHPDTGWGAEVANRNPAWAIADLLTSAVWGEGLADDRIDLQTLYDYSLVWAARQDRCDFTFQDTLAAWSGLQLLARTGRARVFRHGGIYTLARDEWSDLPVTAFTPRNTVPGSMHMHETLPTRDAPDGVIIEYEDNRTWLWTPIECPCPGVVTMQRPERIRIAAITGAKQAEREGRFEAALRTYRRRVAECTTEMQGMIPHVMAPVRWQPETPGYGQTGDVAFWDAGTLVMGLTEPPKWGADPLYLTLIRDDGSLTAPVEVTPGPTANDIVLPAAPDFELVLDSGTRERPQFLLGALVGCDEMVKINSITDGGLSSSGAQLYALESVVDDIRVHTADNALLPGLSEIQDPVDVAGIEDGGGGGGTLLLVALSDHRVEVFSGPSTPLDWRAGYTLVNDGSSSQNRYYAPFGAGATDVFPGEWLAYGAPSPGDAALYEVMATLIGGLAPTSGTTGSWLNLGTSRTWRLDGAVGFSRLQVDIREVGSAIVAESRTITLEISDGVEAGGG